MTILLYLLCILCAVIVFWGVIRKNRLYRVTFFMGMGFISFAIPQLIGMANSEESPVGRALEEGALDMLLFMCMLCLGAVWLGDTQGLRHPGRAALARLNDYDAERLVLASVILTVSGVAINQIGLSMLDPEYLRNLDNQWTGPITIINFFQSMQKYGLALSLLLYWHLRSPMALLTALFNLVANVAMTFIFARRAAAADTVFMCLLSLWFGRRIAIPAWLLLTIFVAGALWSNSIGAFRIKDENVTFAEKFERADMFVEIQRTFTRGGYELNNAAHAIWCASEEVEYDFGGVHWNQLVHGYFPGQIFGHENKRSLMFPTRDLLKEKLNYVPPMGATFTGISDAFCSFWYFGCVKFFIIGYVMGRWYNRGTRGDLRSQLAYMTLMGSALHCITHGTYWLMNMYIHMVIFAYPMLRWARLSQAARR